ncbi:unnamed protein product [Danaus chrysippus]|uniref:(African queen) hypothetical protein n=1 Tax=Danaus chrysippus TaxID=151541 RepID=A0A8J2QWW0_9NEOP|nr:unnamed protein product [Danaus chrysippus]
MVYRILLLLFASCYTVQSQLCVSSTLPAFASPATPQVITSPVVATTIVDNSVSNALANALQLFIVSDLIQSRLGGNCAQNLLNGAVETITPGFAAVDVISPCAAAEIVSPAGILETITPNIYGGVTETLTPIVRGYPDPINTNTYITETFVPNCYNGWTEKVTPCAEVTTNVFNPVFGGVSEIISPQTCGCGSLSPCGCANNIYGLQEIAPVTLPSFGPNYFGALPEVLTNGPCNPNFLNTELMPPLLPNYGVGIPEMIIPNNFMPGFSEVIPSFGQNCYGNLPEVISPVPYTPCGEIISPNPFGPFPNEVITPIGPYGPLSAEMLIPPSIPAQLKCNIGYSNSFPCINFNVEPLPLESTYFNNFPNFYY